MWCLKFSNKSGEVLDTNTTTASHLSTMGVIYSDQSVPYDQPYRLATWFLTYSLDMACTELPLHWPRPLYC